MCDLKLQRTYERWMEGWKVVIHDSEDLSMCMIKGGVTGHRALRQDQILAQVDEECF